MRWGRLYTIIPLALFAITFFNNVRGLVYFANTVGIPSGLFTQTDYVAIDIATTIVNSGRGDRLYDLDLQLQQQQKLYAEHYLKLTPEENKELKYPYPYTPFIAALWAPVVKTLNLTPLTGMALWDLLNIFVSVGGLAYLLISLPLKKEMKWLLLLAAITSFPFMVNLEQGQSSGLILGGLALSVALMRKEHDLPAGLALGLVLLKIQWLPVVVVVLLIKRRVRVLGGTILSGVVLMSITTLTVGTGWIWDYLGIMKRAQTWDRSLALDPWYSHSLSGGLTALIGKGSDALVSYINMGALVLVVILLAFVWQGAWQPGTRRWDGLMALTLLGAIFTNLQANTHDLALLSLPAILGLSFLADNDLRIYAEKQKWLTRSTVWYALIFAAYLVPAFLLQQVFDWPIRMTSMIMLLMLIYLSFNLINYRKSPSPANM